MLLGTVYNEYIPTTYRDFLMTTVNITPAAKKYAEANDMYVEIDTTLIGVGEDDIEIPTISISEENSDFLVCYGINDDGTLYLALKPEYVTGIPTYIETSVQLRNVVKQIVDICVEL